MMNDCIVWKHSGSSSRRTSTRKGIRMSTNEWIMVAGVVRRNGSIIPIY